MNKKGVYKKIKLYLYFIDNPYTLGLYESFKTENWKLLNDALYQSARQRLLDITEDGYDHSGGFWEVLEEDIFEKLKFPEVDGFVDEFAIWQKDNNYPKGELFIIYPKELDFMNKVLRCNIPICRLHNPYKNKKVMYRECETMRECIVKELTL